MVIAAFFVGATVGQRSGDGGIGSIFDSSGSAELSSEAIDVINESYFRNVDDEKLEDASVKGMVAELRKHVQGPLLALLLAGRLLASSRSSPRAASRAWA